MGRELDPEIHARVAGLSEEGNAMADNGDTLGAWKKYAGEACN